MTTTYLQANISPLIRANKRSDNMTDKTEPTIEELQSQILELKEQNESNATKIKELEGNNAKLNEDLASSRSLNAKLMRNLPADGEKEKESEEHEETQDEFLDSFINPALERLGKR